MRFKPIGVVGGAGPLAGVFFLERLIRLCSTLYNCHKDGDFPKIHLLSFPFSDMLSSEIDREAIQAELSGCLDTLRKTGAEVLVIACNTLHAFIDPADDRADLVHLPRETAISIPLSETPLVLCTTTSMKFGLHKQFFPCSYPDSKTQIEVDRWIDRVLQGQNKHTLLDALKRILESQSASTIILGCTELSLFYPDLDLLGKTIVDPLEVAARKVLEKSLKCRQNRGP